ncbi:hypothetical protein BDV95DRAFT_598862 [Massariosphaeria phaeospora]|uniref:Uncharacterized protein n=1 Tax=Massariosphaeria phaeospora TaxID=100035 RepID=A0A7C8M5X4_9PLEO|nr:hypothetical protein BDV95DRAFT_598862 [Massariosphaeria phaeospora]
MSARPTLATSSHGPLDACEPWKVASDTVGFLACLPWKTSTSNVRLSSRRSPCAWVSSDPRQGARGRARECRHHANAMSTSPFRLQPADLQGRGRVSSRREFHVDGLRAPGLQPNTAYRYRCAIDLSISARGLALRAFGAVTLSNPYSNPSNSCT